MDQNHLQPQEPDPLSQIRISDVRSLATGPGIFQEESPALGIRIESVWSMAPWPNMDIHAPYDDDDDDDDQNPSMSTVALNNLMTDDNTSDSSDSRDLLFDSNVLASSSSSIVSHDVTAQLAAAGPVGRAAAAAIASGKKRRQPHSFETNPAVRKRQQTRLSKKLKAIIDEYSVRVGQQAVVLVVTPGKPSNNFKAFGANPLENVVRKCKNVIMEELENALTEHIPDQSPEDPSLYELPPLVIDGIPTPVEKMTQAQLRAFIPLMLRYSTGRGKPGWGRESTKPRWWPEDLPWASVRSDARTEEQKLKVSWTHALRQIVINCYKYHGREDLLPKFTEEDDERLKAAAAISEVPSTSAAIQSAVVQTVNPDGPVAVLHIDPNGTLFTLPDGTQVEVQTVNRWPCGSQVQGEVNHDGHANQEIITAVTDTHLLSSPSTSFALELKSGATAAGMAALSQDGHIIFTAEDGSQNSIPIANMVTIPASVYQAFVANISNISDVNSVHSTPCITSVESQVNGSGSNSPASVNGDQ